MALYTGMRRGELFKLRWKDIDFDRGVIRIVAPKGGTDQTIPLNYAARKVLEAHPRRSDFTFPGEDGGQRVTIQKALRCIRRERRTAEHHHRGRKSLGPERPHAERIQGRSGLLQRTGYLPITMAAYELTKEEGFYVENPGTETALKQLTLHKPTEKSKVCALEITPRRAEL